jgi:hypothetical protein
LNGLLLINVNKLLHARNACRLGQIFVAHCRDFKAAGHSAKLSEYRLHNGKCNVSVRMKWFDSKT